MSALAAYFKYRSKEFIVWLGIPILGVAFSDGDFSFSRLWLFGGMIVCAMINVLFLNDWGGLKKNPNEITRFADPKHIKNILKILFGGAILSLLLSFYLAGFLFPLRTVIFLAICGTALNLFYSSPSIHLKEDSLAATILHIAGGELQFLLGYLVFSFNYPRALAIGLFFSLVFAAGHLVHECIDAEEDRQGAVKTRAIRFGIPSTLATSISIFSIAHAYFLLLAILNIISWKTFWIFAPAFLIHLKFIRFLLNRNIAIERVALLSYRRFYRWIYAICSILLIGLNLSQTF